MIVKLLGFVWMWLSFVMGCFFVFFFWSFLYFCVILGLCMRGCIYGMFIGERYRMDGCRIW